MSRGVNGRSKNSKISGKNNQSNKRNALGVKVKPKKFGVEEAKVARAVFKVKDGNKESLFMSNGPSLQGANPMPQGPNLSEPANSNMGKMDLIKQQSIHQHVMEKNKVEVQRPNIDLKHKEHAGPSLKEMEANVDVKNKPPDDYTKSLHLIKAGEQWLKNSGEDVLSLLGNSSHLWKDIVKCWPNVEKNIAWNLGDGNSIKFWLDSWVPGLSNLGSMAICDIPDHEKEASVSRYTTPNGDWNWTKFHFYFDQRTLDKIAAMLPPSPTSHQDTIRWKPSKDGSFSVKSAYEAISSSSTCNQSGFWKKVWQWPVPERVRQFLWCMGHDKLLTNSHRKARNISSDDICPRCASSGETILHVLRDCHGSHSLWTRLLSPSTWRVFFSLNLVDWIQWNHAHHANGTLGLDWKILFAISCWIIWKKRNKLVFENISTSVDDLYFSILNFARAVERSREDLKITAHIPQRITRFVGWQPPRTGGVKCNVDGSVHGVHHSATCGGVIRDEAGNVLLAFSRNLGSYSITWAELHDIFDGLDLLSSRGFKTIELDSDSSTAIALLTSVVDESHPCYPLIHHIKRMLERHWVVVLKHVYRESNKVADFMARMGFPSWHNPIQSAFRSVDQSGGKYVGAAEVPIHISASLASKLGFAVVC
ncbi:putative ribonuclease H protein At1g65750 family [Senna tora]|uniref:Putative ribonuclease H protein At1g65750 family n=1 Tax=Senna tora TaxID=362788 RepID=A0A834XH64_9FABA|nr:putative ribonuclease H protein At1g65750 family [Senna tora]